MNKLLIQLEKHIVKTEDMNTNNAWGFGGAIKTVYTLDNGMTLHRGTACFRHMKSQRFFNLRSDGRILTEDLKEMVAILEKEYPEMKGKL